MKKRLLITMILVLLTLGITLPASALIAEGKMAPDFTLSTPDGKTELTLADLKGKTIYIDFWASWCGPCRKAWPEVVELHKKYSEQGLVVLAISLDRSTDAAIKYMNKNETPFTVLFDTGGKVARTFGVTGIPAGVVISPEGVVIRAATGFDPREMPALEAKIKEGLKSVKQVKGASKI
jgi:cytochrome c biogenesis protein CcmG, thiol:disulfide interchange protein DsbE